MDYIPTLLDYYDIVPQEKDFQVKHKKISQEYVKYIIVLLKTKTIKQVAEEANVSYHRVWHIQNKLHKH
jgi:hypothetical protein